VPWLKDSTPAWSTRGRLRENLLPCLRDTYGDGAERSLRALAIGSDALSELVEVREAPTPPAVSTRRVLEPCVSFCVGACVPAVCHGSMRASSAGLAHIARDGT
jgi:hypothetical protein